MNEISKICELAGIRTADVLAAAGTKWNFLKFHPGLVGGHCIGVDPYYLTAKAEELGHHPEVILSGRRDQRRNGRLCRRSMSSSCSPAMTCRCSKARVGDPRLHLQGKCARHSQLEGDRHLRQASVLRGRTAGARSAGRSEGDARRIWNFIVRVGRVAFHECARPRRAACGFDELGPDRLCGMVQDGGIFVDVKSRFGPETVRPDLVYWSL